MRSTYYPEVHIKPGTILSKLNCTVCKQFHAVEVFVKRKCIKSTYARCSCVCVCVYVCTCVCVCVRVCVCVCVCVCV